MSSFKDLYKLMPEFGSALLSYFTEYGLIQSIMWFVNGLLP